MKARLIRRNEKIQLLLRNGQIKNLTIEETKEFLKSYDDESHYTEDTTWDYEISMEDFNGETLAIINDDGLLCFHDAEFFKAIVEVQSTYLSVAEYATKHGKQSAIVRRHCSTGKIPGAFYKGKTWLIPETAAYPDDTRCKKTDI